MRNGCEEEMDGRKLKKELQNKFIGWKFSVKSTSSSYRIKTNLLKPYLHMTDAVYRATYDKNPSESDYLEFEKYEEVRKYNEEQKNKIKEITRKYEEIRYCQYTSEILEGANTFVFIEPL